MLTLTTDKTIYYDTDTISFSVVADASWELDFIDGFFIAWGSDSLDFSLTIPEIFVGYTVPIVGSHTMRLWDDNGESYLWTIDIIPTPPPPQTNPTGAAVVIAAGILALLLFKRR